MPSFFVLLVRRPDRVTALTRRHAQPRGSLLLGVQPTPGRHAKLLVRTLPEVVRTCMAVPVWIADDQ
jgi:hypothetical protein